jgi:hypothetical protein
MWLKHFLHNKYVFYKLELFLQLLMEILVFGIICSGR